MTFVGPTVYNDLTFINAHFIPGHSFVVSIHAFSPVSQSLKDGFEHEWRDARAHVRGYCVAVLCERNYESLLFTSISNLKFKFKSEMFPTLRPK